MAVISAHTNWDVASGGTADALAGALGLQSVEQFAPLEQDAAHGESLAIGRIGSFDGGAGRLASLVEAELGGTVRLAGMATTTADRVAVLPGSGGSFVGAAIEAGADVMVTGDVSHHEARLAMDHGVAVIDPGHAPTERPGVRALYAAVVEIVADAIDLTGIDDSPWEGS